MKKFDKLKAEKIIEEILKTEDDEIFTVKDNALYIDGRKVIKAWESFSGWYWFAIERAWIQDSVIDGKVYKNDQIWFGYIQGLENEWGYFSQAEIENLYPQTWEIPHKDLIYSGRRKSLKIFKICDIIRRQN